MQLSSEGSSPFDFQRGCCSPLSFACEILEDRGVSQVSLRRICPADSLLLMEMQKPERSQRELQSSRSVGKASS